MGEVGIVDSVVGLVEWVWTTGIDDVKMDELVGSGVDCLVERGQGGYSLTGRDRGENIGVGGIKGRERG